MNEHTKITELVLDADCYYGECDHEEDCPPHDLEVCDSCIELADDEIVWYVPWEYAETQGHAVAGPSSPEYGEGGTEQ